MPNSKPNDASKPAKPEAAPAAKADAAKRSADAVTPAKAKPADPVPSRAPAAVAKAVAPAAVKPVQAAVAKAAEPATTKKSETKIETPAAAPVAAVNKGMQAMNTRIETEIKKNADTAAAQGQAMFTEMSDRSKTAMDKGNKMIEQIVDLAKGNVEAFVASSRLAAKGAESLTREAAEFGRKRVETATATMKSFASAKSPTEVFQLQSDYAKSAFDSMIAETSKISEAWMKIAGEAFEPITSRYAVAADKFKQVAA